MAPDYKSKRLPATIISGLLVILTTTVLVLGLAPRDATAPSPVSLSVTEGANGSDSSEGDGDLHSEQATGHAGDDSMLLDGQVTPPNGLAGEPDGGTLDGGLPSGGSGATEPLPSEDATHDLSLQNGCRMLVSLPEGVTPRSEDAVIGSYGTTYLVEHPTSEDMAYYDAVARFTADDVTVSIAEGEHDEIPEPASTTSDTDPLSELGMLQATQLAARLGAPAGDVDDPYRPVVALLDTGAPVLGDGHLTRSVSVLGDDGADRNGHATTMLGAILAQSPDAQVMSVKVLDDTGHGTASSVYAGIVYAVDNGARIINCSFAGPDAEGNQAIREAVQYALDRGVVVIVAAGNGGYDADLITPANVEGAFTVGSAEGGKPRPDSNRGACVDAYVEARSTSVAAATVSGQVSLGLDGWKERVRSLDGLDTDATEVDGGAVDTGTGTMPGDGVTAQELTPYTLTFDAGTGTFSNGTTNVIDYTPGTAMVTKYSHTPNVSDDGIQDGYYPNNADITEVVTIDGATSLTVTIKYQTQGYYYDWACVWSGSHPEYSPSGSSGSSVSGRLYGTSTQTSSYNIPGSSVTFGFHSNSTGNAWYGYHATVRGTGDVFIPTGEYEEPVPSDPSQWFLGWKLNGEYVDWESVRESTTLTASYGNPIIHYDANGGGGTMGDVDLRPGAVVSESEFSLPAGTHAFIEWNTEADGSGTAYAPGDPISGTESVTLYAQWAGPTAGTAYAISTSNNELILFRSLETYTAGSGKTVTDLAGNTYTGQVFTGIEDTFTRVPWSNWTHTVQTFRVADGQIVRPSSCKGFLSGLSQLTDCSLDGLDTSAVTDMSEMFNGCSKLSSISLSGLNLSAVTDMSAMFSRCSKLSSISLSGLNLSAVTDMSEMFNGCSALQSVDLTGIDTSSVTDMSQMFSSCFSLESLDLSSLNTASVSDMSSMLSQCYVLTSLRLGPDFAFVSSANGDAGLQSGSVAGSDYDGTWRNVDVSGAVAVTGQDLMQNYDGSLTAGNYARGTYVQETERSDGVAIAMRIGDELVFVRRDSAVPSGDGYLVTDKNDITYQCEDIYENVETGVREWPDEGIAHVRVAEGNTIQPVTMNGWFSDMTELETCDMTGFDTSQVTGTNSMFSGTSALQTVSMSGLDLSAVTAAAGMFAGAGDGNLEIDMSNVAMPVSCNAMFQSSNAKTINLTNADFSNTTSTSAIFMYCPSLTSLDLSGLDFSSCINSGSMFYDCGAEGFSVSLHGTKLPINCYAMFVNCQNLASIDLSDADSSATTNISAMFTSCSSLKVLDMSGLDMSHVTDVSGMASSCSLDELNISGWHIEDFGPREFGPFGGCSTKRLIARDVDLGRVTSLTNFASINGIEHIDLSGMTGAALTDLSFSGCSAKTIDLTDVSFPSMRSLASLFSGCSSLTEIRGISELDTSNITSLYATFAACRSLESLDLSSWNTANVTEFNGTFGNCASLKTLNISGWDMRRCSGSYPLQTTGLGSSDMHLMYFYAHGLKTQNASMAGLFSSIGTRTLKYVDLSDANFAGSTDFTYMFDGCENLELVNLTGINTPAATKLSRMFSRCSSLRDVAGIGDLDVENVTETEGMFSHCSSLVSLDLSNWNVTKMRDASCMFEYCPKLRYIHVPRWRFEGHSVTFSDFAKGCSSLEFLGMENWDLRPVGVNWAFGSSSSFGDARSIDASGWKLAHQSDKSIQCMFQNRSYLHAINLSGWTNSASGSTTPLIAASELFSYCSSLRSVDMSDWTNLPFMTIDNMFVNCSNLTQADVAGMDTSHVANMSSTFANCHNLSDVIGISDWDTSGTTNMYAMFTGCTSLRSLDLSNWDTADVRTTYGMFQSCQRLTSLDLSGWSTASIEEMGMKNLMMGDSSLRKIRLGEGFSFEGDTSYLPYPDWIHLETGTVVSDLWNSYDGSTTMAGTYVPVIDRITTDLVKAVDYDATRRIVTLYVMPDDYQTVASMGNPAISPEFVLDPSVVALNSQLKTALNAANENGTYASMNLTLNIKARAYADMDSCASTVEHYATNSSGTPTVIWTFDVPKTPEKLIQLDAYDKDGRLVGRITNSADSYTTFTYQAYDGNASSPIGTPQTLLPNARHVHRDLGNSDFNSWAWYMGYPTNNPPIEGYADKAVYPEYADYITYDPAMNNYEVAMPAGKYRIEMTTPDLQSIPVTATTVTMSEATPTTPSQPTAYGLATTDAINAIDVTLFNDIKRDAYDEFTSESYELGNLRKRDEKTYSGVRGAVYRFTGKVTGDVAYGMTDYAGDIDGIRVSGTTVTSTLYRIYEDGVMSESYMPIAGEEYVAEEVVSPTGYYLNPDTVDVMFYQAQIPAHYEGFARATMHDAITMPQNALNVANSHPCCKSQDGFCSCQEYGLYRHTNCCGVGAESVNTNRRAVSTRDMPWPKFAVTKNADGGVGLAGAHLQVLEGDEVVDDWVSDGTVHVFQFQETGDHGIAYGETGRQFVLHEVDTPGMRYLLAEDIPFTVSYDSGTVQLTMTDIELVDVSVTKAWSPIVPDGAIATLELLVDGEPTGETVVLDGVADTDGEDSAWVAKFTDKPKYHTGTVTEITYTVRENSATFRWVPRDPTPVSSGGTITNVYQVGMPSTGNRGIDYALVVACLSTVTAGCCAILRQRMRRK